MFTDEDARQTAVSVLHEVSFEDAIALWMDTLANRSHHTRDGYQITARQFASYLQSNGVTSVPDVTVGTLRSWTRDLNLSELKASSIQTKQASVRGFLLHCIREGLAHPALTSERVRAYVSSPPVPRGYSPRTFLDKSEIAALFRVAKSERDRLLLHVALSTGLRVSELVNLQVSHFASKENGGAVLSVIGGKGNKNRAIGLSPAVFSPIRRYIADHQVSGGLFDMSDERIRQIVYTLGLRAKLTKRVTPHVLRHTAATQFILAGGALEKLRLILGHSDLTITGVYLHIADAVRDDGYEVSWLPDYDQQELIDV